MSLSVDIQTIKNLNPTFDEYFASIYKERWPQILEALAVKEKQILRQNYFCQFSDTFFKENNFTNFFSKNKTLPEVFSRCFNVEIELNTQLKTHGLEGENQVLAFYKMDPASVVVAAALEVKPDDLVLDVCAAPGGKSLILAEGLNFNLQQGEGEQVSNEYSNSRRERLTRVIKEYIPHELRQNIYVQGKDGNAFGQHKADTFTRILADVPCSGERHLLENTEEFKLWTKRRSENLAIRQYSLLSSAYFAAQVGARIVYSTCSISPLENDDVVKKLNKKRSIKFVDIEWLNDVKLENGDSFIEKTEFGYQILPDKCGFGPMYFSVIEKCGEVNEVKRKY